MSIWEALSVASVILFALYGAARFVAWLVWRLVGPSRKMVLLVTSVDNGEAELQLRSAVQTAKFIGAPLWIIRENWDTHTASKVQRLCGECRIIDVQNAEKISDDACTVSKKRV